MQRENANNSCTFVHLSLLAQESLPAYDRIVKKKTPSKGITLKTVIDHIQAFQQRTEMRFESLEKRMDERFAKMDDRFTKVDQRFDKLDQRLAWMDLRISNIDERLDRIEITMIEQNHEGRIRKCEKAIATLNRR